MHSPCLSSMEIDGLVVYAVQHEFTLNINEQLPSKIMLNPYWICSTVHLVDQAFFHKRYLHK